MITYAITVCTEAWELNRLLGILIDGIMDGDQILVQADDGKVTTEVEIVVEKYRKLAVGRDIVLKYIRVPMDDDFAAFKNAIFENSDGYWIFQIDADEYPIPSLLTSLYFILEENDVDVLWVPRINTVNGITHEHVKMWRWRVDAMRHPKLRNFINESKSPEVIRLLRDYGLVIGEDAGTIKYYEPVINFPDYQCRIYRNLEGIRWENKVHERLTGFESHAQLPADITYCLMHEKEIDKQISQNEFYSKILQK